jgi:hypothetical protein
VYVVLVPENVGGIAVKNNWSSKSRIRIRAVDELLVALPFDGIAIVTVLAPVSIAVTNPVPLKPDPLTVYPVTSAFVPRLKLLVKPVYGYLTVFASIKVGADVVGVITE